MPHHPAPEPFTALASSLRRAITDVESAASRRRAEADHVRTRWLGGRRLQFDLASAELDAVTSRALGDLRTLARVADSLAGGGR